MVNVQEFIRRVGISDHEELAQKLGIKKGTVDSWSSGSRSPTYEVCVRLLELGMTVEELFGKPYPSSARTADEDFERKATFFVKKLLSNIDRL